MNSCSFSAEVVIGFDPVSYSANEGDRFVSFTILLNGTLSQAVVIEFYTESGSAIGELQLFDNMNFHHSYSPTSPHST